MSAPMFRGLVADWPVVEAGRASPQALSAYLRAFDRGHSIGAMLGPPRIGGRFFYNNDLTGFNYKRESVKLAGAFDFLLSVADEDRPPSFAVQSVPAAKNLPGFAEDNPEIAEFLGNLTFTTDQAGEFYYAHDKEGKELSEIAAAWIADNPDVVASFLEGVEDAEGQPATETFAS